MSSHSSTVSAYRPAPSRPGILGAIFSDKARLRRFLMIWGVLAFLGVAAAIYLSGGRYVGSDDSYVHANKLMVSTDVSGLIQSVAVREGQTVKKGQVLFTIDPKPFQIAVENAKAALIQARQDVESTRAAYRSAMAQANAQEAQAAVNRTTYQRYLALAQQNAIAPVQVDAARAAQLSAEATVASLRQNAANQLAKLSGNPNLPAEQTPSYLKAQAAAEEAQRQLDHTVVRAPFDGIVSEVDSLQPGTLVISAMSAFSTTSAVGLIGKEIWIESDMKETDLTHLHPGQPAEVTVDTYPGCRWNGHIASINAGSDTSFSALPSENASGNWVKVVQRIPVRINLDHASCNQSLRAGMSAVVSIDTGHRRWWRLMNGG